MSDVTQTSFLTQRKKGESHLETTMQIDWRGATPEQILLLAQQALIYEFQCKLRNGVIKREDAGKATIVVKDAVHAQIYIAKEFAPTAPRGSVKDGSIPTLEDLLKKLSPEELAILLAEVA